MPTNFGGSEAIITALSDEFPIIGNHREIFVACLFSFYFLIGLASCSQGGFYVFHLLDRYAAGYSMLFAVFAESIAVSWIYGTDRFCDDIKDMVGSSPGFYWRVCWKFIAPLFIIFIIIYGLMGYEPLSFEDYTYPQWANIVGWIIASSSVSMIPGIAIIQLIVTPGTFIERLSYLTTPWKDNQSTDKNMKSSVSSLTNGAFKTSLVQVQNCNNNQNSFLMLKKQRKIFRPIKKNHLCSEPV